MLPSEHHPPNLTIAPFNLAPHVTPFGRQTVMSQPEAATVLAAPRPDPDDWLALSNYAAAHYIAGSLTTARDYAYRSIDRQRNSSTLLNLAVILEAAGEFRLALRLAEEALPADPDNIVLGGLVADGLLRVGRWTEGWPLYLRYHACGDGPRRYLPEWDGRSDLRGRRILVLEGGGFGDTFYFLRWLPRLHSWGAHITYAGPTSLLPLLIHQGYIDRTIPTYRGQLYPLDFQGFDCFTSILALAGRLAVTSDDVLWRGPYVAPGPTRPCPLRGNRSRVGLCWRAGEDNYPRAHRTLTNGQRDRLVAAGRRVQWVNLTHERTLPGAAWSPPLRDWTDTSAAVAACDLVVTVDTGVAHLAGAQGTPTMVVLPGASAWQYGLDSERTPLYPSMRLFRNQGEGIDGAIDLACRELEAL